MSASTDAGAAASKLQQAWQQARRHALLEIALLNSPWLLPFAVLGWRLGAPWAWFACIVVVATGAAWALWRWLRLDRDWLTATLDARRPDMDDSAALLFHDAPGSAPSESGLEALQRERLRQRIAASPAPDLRLPWHRRRLWTNLGLAAFATLAMWFWPMASDGIATGDPSDVVEASTERPPRLTHRQLTITPPAYTGQSPRSGEALSVKVPVGSRLSWSLRYAPRPASVTLVFYDGSKLALRRTDDETWTGQRRVDTGLLYRIETTPKATGSNADAQHRIDAVPDKPPQVRVLQPARTVTTVAPGQRGWSVVFEASDDHGLGASARLRVTRTQGSGENITSSARELRVSGRGSAKKRRYAHGFDLAQLGLVPGDDLIVRLEVGDRRSPNPQTAKSPSLILRWPPPKAELATGLDGLARQVMPAYFRSQRQIIIDAEALLKEKPKLAADRFLQRSDAIGVDQRLLRLRYGQFLGEESEGAPRAPLPTSDALPTSDTDPLPTSDALPTSDPPAAASEPSTDDGHAHAPDEGRDHGEDHAAGTMQRQAVFGEEVQVLERFGHTHDIPEAATLLDPKTRETLRAALNEMWDSEQALRTGHPDRALPFAYRALDLIKQVQQSERIYLQKVGVELEPVDFSRRMSGDRAGLGDRSDPMADAVRRDDPLAASWRTLSSGDDARPVDLDLLARQVAARGNAAGDPLSVAAAIDALRRDPRCRDCRQALADQLWPLLQRPPAAPRPRDSGGREGAAYLDALQRGDRP